MDRFYLNVKDPRNKEATMIIPLDDKSFDRDIIRVEYEGKTFEASSEDEDLLDKKNFVFNIHALEEKKVKNIASYLEKIQICQNQIEKFEEEIEGIKIYINDYKNEIANYANLLSKEVFDAAFDHKGLTVKPEDIKAGDIFLLIDYKNNWLESNWASMYIFTVTKVTSFYGEPTVLAEKISITGYENWETFCGNVEHGQYDLVRLINNCNKACRLTEEQRVKIKTRFVNAVLDTDYKTLVQDIEKEYAHLFEVK